jgi:putative transposase
VSAFIDRQKELGFAVELVCRTLGVSRSAYYQRAAGCRSTRAVADEQLVATIRKVHIENFEAYGYRKMQLALRRHGVDVGRDRVKRLMRADGIRGAKRPGKRWKTTTPDPQAGRRLDLVERDFTASRPDALYVADLTYLRCWEGLVFLAFVIDVYSRRVVGWQLAPHMRASLVCDALKMAAFTRPRGADVALIHHSDRGSQGGFNWSSQRLSEEGCDGQAGWVDDRVDGQDPDEVAGEAVAATRRRAPVLA